MKTERVWSGGPKYAGLLLLSKKVTEDKEEARRIFLKLFNKMGYNFELNDIMVRELAVIIDLEEVI